MNISSNNVRGLSQYSLLNKLFSQKNGNKTSTSNQMGAAISGGVKHKQRNLYYDENGICNLVLFPQTGQYIHCKVCIELLLLSDYFLKISTAWLVTPNKSSRSQTAK